MKYLLRLVEYHLQAKFGAHHQWPEILCAGYEGAWKAIVDVEETGACMRSTAAVKGAVYAALDWLRGPENEQRRRTKRRVAVPRQVPVEAADRAECALPDFAPRVLAREAAAAQLAAWQKESGLSELDWRILERTLGDGEGGKQVARELGIGVKELRERRAGALARLRGEEP